MNSHAGTVQRTEAFTQGWVARRFWGGEREAVPRITTAPDAESSHASGRGYMATSFEKRRCGLPRQICRRLECRERKCRAWETADAWPVARDRAQFRAKQHFAPHPQIPTGHGAKFDTRSVFIVKTLNARHSAGRPLFTNLALDQSDATLKSLW